MSLSDFASLAEAQAFELITDKLQVGSGQARGFLVSEGIWTTLRQIQGDITSPFFALADAVIVTASDASSYFGLDTTTAEGAGNLAAANTMVAAGLMTEAQKVSLLALALKTTYPHATATQADFAKAKGLMTYAQVTPINGWLKITTTADCETHRPQIHADIQGMKRRVAGFDVVSVAGDYLTQVPREYGVLFVDNAYSVIS
jgi:hypothetical protein